ncbi:unnamed protein product, partial [Pleuronectes platessa]
PDRIREILGETVPGITVVSLLLIPSVTVSVSLVCHPWVEEESRSRKEGLFQEDECIGQDQQHQPHGQERLARVPGSLRQQCSSQVVRLKYVPPPTGNTPKGRSESPLLKKSPALSSLVANKRGGRRLRIDLKKGSEGLGFTVVTRDSSVHGPGPILVKNILTRGAAVKDGRLQSGDRILEVNGVDITGVGQEELVCMLRGTRQGESVGLVVLRPEEMFLPREMSFSTHAWLNSTAPGPALMTEDVTCGPSKPLQQYFYFVV